METMVSVGSVHRQPTPLFWAQDERAPHGGGPEEESCSDHGRVGKQRERRRGEGTTEKMSPSRAQSQLPLATSHLPTSAT